MEYFFLYFIMTLAIERLVEITVTADLGCLDKMRQNWMRWFPRLATLAECKYCQSFWVAMMVGLVTPFSLVQGAFFHFWPGYVAKSVLLSGIPEA